MSEKPQAPKNTPKPKDKNEELNEKELDKVAGGRGRPKKRLL